MVLVKEPTGLILSPRMKPVNCPSPGNGGLPLMRKSPELLGIGLLFLIPQWEQEIRRWVWRPIKPLTVQICPRVQCYPEAFCTKRFTESPRASGQDPQWLVSADHLDQTVSAQWAWPAWEGGSSQTRWPRSSHWGSVMPFLLRASCVSLLSTRPLLIPQGINTHTCTSSFTIPVPIKLPAPEQDWGIQGQLVSSLELPKLVPET